MLETKSTSLLGFIPGHLKSIDLLRGVAALAVVADHAINYGENLRTDIPWFSVLHTVLSNGALGVPLFFVISGFCIHLRWAKQYSTTGQSGLSLVDFWKRRVHRLYPPYFVVLCFSMTMVLVGYLLHKNVPLVTAYPEPRPLWMGMDFIAHLTMLHGLFPVFDRMGGNPPFWTLAREEYFYILYFGLLAWRWRYGLRSSTFVVFIIGLIFPVLLGLWLAPDSPWWGTINSSAIVLWIQWCLGMVAVEAYYGLVKLPRLCRVVWMVPFWAIAGFLSTDYFPLVSPACWGMAFFTLLNYCIELERNGAWPKFRFFGWLAGVGIFSYSLYLVHNPIRALLKQLLGPLADTPNPILYLIIAFGMSVAGYYGAKVFYALVESHFINTRSTQAESAPSSNLAGQADILGSKIL